MADISIRQAIMLFQYSFTGQGANGSFGTLPRRVTDKLWQLYAHHEIGLGRTERRTTRASWEEGRPGFDLLVSQSFIDRLPEDQRLGVVSLELVHEAVHSIIHRNYILEEMEARTLQVFYYREMTGLGVSNEETDRFVHLPVNAVPSLQRQSDYIRRDQLVDWVLGKSTEYVESLTAAWVVNHVNQWGGIANRWATSKGHFIRVLTATYNSAYTDLILRIMESVRPGDRDHWDEMMEHAGPRRRLQSAIEPSRQFTARIAALERRWGVHLIEEPPRR